MKLKSQNDINTKKSAKYAVPKFKTILEDTLTVFDGEWLDLRARGVQIAAIGLFSPLIYIYTFGLGLGSTIDNFIKPTAGVNYLQFILPGMVALSSMTISFGGTTFSICGNRLLIKKFEELLLPVHPLALHLGKMLAGILRGVMTAISVILVAILFTGKISSFLNPLFLIILILNCAVFAGLGVIIGLRVKSLENVSLYNNFLIVPMSFLGGTFFDPSNLPATLKVVVHCLPLTYTSIGLRSAAYLPLSDFPWYCIAILLILAIALSAAGTYQFSLPIKEIKTLSN
nr:ABC transporter permease [Pleurocapsa sp. PCC 7319]